MLNSPSRPERLKLLAIAARSPRTSVHAPSKCKPAQNLCRSIQPCRSYGLVPLGIVFLFLSSCVQYHAPSIEDHYFSSIADVASSDASPSIKSAYRALSRLYAPIVLAAHEFPLDPYQGVARVKEVGQVVDINFNKDFGGPIDITAGETRLHLPDTIAVIYAAPLSQMRLTALTYGSDDGLSFEIEKIEGVFTFFTANVEHELISGYGHVAIHSPYMQVIAMPEKKLLVEMVGGFAVFDKRFKVTSRRPVCYEFGGGQEPRDINYLECREMGHPVNWLLTKSEKDRQRYIDELRKLLQTEREEFKQGAFQCLNDWTACKDRGFARLDCELIMIVCVTDNLIH